jgi:phage terminase Nu1 subunit (DNA packaging protein)
LPGGTKAAVEKAVLDGRIDYDPSVGVDAEAADAQWAERTVGGPPAKGQHGGDRTNGKGHGRSAAEGRARLEWAKAELAELELAKRKGELVERVAVSRREYAEGRRCRDRLLAIPDRVSAELVPMRSAAKIRARLLEEIREACTEISGWGPAGLDDDVPHGTRGGEHG